MGTVDTPKQTIKEFIENLLDDLTVGRITPEAAIVAAGQYASLRHDLVGNLEKIALSQKRGAAISVDAVKEALRLVKTSLEAAPPQFQAERPDSPLSPKDVLERARSFGAAQKTVTEAATNQRARVETLRKTFIAELVNNWIAKSREAAAAMDGGKPEEEALRRALERTLTGDPSAPDFIKVAESKLRDAGGPNNISQAVIRSADPTRQKLSSATQALTNLKATEEAILARAGQPLLEEFAIIATRVAASSGLPPERMIQRAETLFRAAQAALSPTSRATVSSSDRFFGGFAQGPVQKVVAAAADALFAQLSPVARQEVIRSVFSHALEGVLAKTDNLTLRLGKDFVESELFQLIAESARKELSRDAGRRGVTQARSVVSDIFSSVLTGPITRPLLSSPHETVLNYFGLVALSAGLPDNKRGLFKNFAPAINQLSAAPAAAGRGSDWAAGASVLEGLPTLQTYYLMLMSLSPTQRPTARPGELIGIGQSSGGSSPGSAIASALGWAGLGLAGVAGRAGNSLLQLVFGGVPFSPFGRRTEKTSFWEDMPLVIAVFVGVTIVLLFVLPTVLNFGFIDKITTDVALMMGVEKERLSGRGVGIEGKRDIVYTGPMPQPPSVVSGCPIGQAVSASISQCPNDQRSDYSHYFTHPWSNAYDIALSSSTEVFSTHDGYLVEYVSDVPENSGTDYGNYVVLAGQDLSGKLYFTIYGHLLRVSDVVKEHCGGAARCSGSGGARPVPARTLLGKSDNTGASTGPHLHYELRNADGTKPPFVLPEGCGGYHEGLACNAL